MNPPLIVLERIGKVYRTGDTELHALRDVSFTIQAGEYVAIMGPSGCGKSTLMNLLGCLDLPSAGRYCLAGRDVASLDAATLAGLRNSTIGFVFQSFNLLARQSAAQNVMLPLVYAGLAPAARVERARETLAAVGLGARGAHLPTQLSGGQNQRVAIARALVNRPQLLLADEPTGALDSRTGVEIMQLFEELHGRGNTIVLVTHDAGVAARARRVLRFLDGQLVGDQRSG